MTNNTNQQISEFLDGELDSSEHKLFFQSAKDSENQATWHRYSIISDVMRKELPDTLNHNLFSRVQQALESEPAILSPQTNHPTEQLNPAEQPSQVAAMDKHRSKGPMIGMGIAASLALATVVGVQMFETEQDPTPFVASQTQTTSPANVQQVATQVLNAPPKVESVAGLDRPVVKPHPPAIVLGNSGFGDESEWNRLESLGESPLLSPYPSESGEFSVISPAGPSARIVSFGEAEQAQ